MAKRTYSPEEYLYLEGAPLIITSISSSRGRGRRDVQIKLKRVGIRPVRSAEVVITELNTGRELGHALVKNESENGLTASTAVIPLSADAGKYSVSIPRIILCDDTELLLQGDWTPLTTRTRLEIALESRDVADEFRLQYGNDCVFFPLSERGVWTCTCGTVNSMDEDRCSNCRRRYAAFQSINLTSLKIEAARHAEMRTSADEKEAAREEKRLQRALRCEKAAKGLSTRFAARQSRDEEETVHSVATADSAAEAAMTAQEQQPDKKRRLPLFLLLPFILLFVCLIAVIPSFLQNKKTYNAAAELLAENRFDEATEAFSAMGVYGDSSEQVEKNIPYEKACYILRCAKVCDPNALSLLNLSAEQFTDTDHLQLALFTEAAQQFDALGNYKDSLLLRQEARQGASDIEHKLLQGSYDDALNLLQAGRYNEAQEAFSELGNYSDSQKQVLECDYQKAEELLRFCESYNSRDVFASISETIGTPSVFSVSASAEERLGAKGVAALEALLAADGATVLHEDTPGDGFVQITSAASNLFASLNNYKDSAKNAERALTAGDFTKPFYDYCSSGNINAALLWLNSYDGEFEDREAWIRTINMFLPFVGDWNFRNGDSTLIPYSAGVMDTSSPVLSTSVAIRDSHITLQVYFNSIGDRIVLEYDWDLSCFVNYGDIYRFFADLNNSSNFVYMSYGENGMLSSCEYARS